MGQCQSTEDRGASAVIDGGSGGSGAPVSKLRAQRRCSQEPRPASGAAAAAVAAAAAKALRRAASLVPRAASGARQAAAFEEPLDLMESPTNPELDNILTLATGIFGAPTAVLALFHDKRVDGGSDWHKSMCAWPCCRGGAAGALVVPNAREDPRFASHPCVQSGAVSFYAGAPLITGEGRLLGTICCADPVPRASGCSQHQLAVLSKFADVVAQKLERGMCLPPAADPSAATADGPTRPLRTASFDVGCSRRAGSNGGRGGGAGGGRGAAAAAFAARRSFSAGAAGAGCFEGCESLQHRPSQGQLARHPSLPLPAPAAGAAADEAGPRAGPGAGRATAGPGRRGAAAATPEASAQCPVPGLLIGSQISKGSYGRVFTGKYFGSRVAVKVLEESAVHKRYRKSDVPLEAVLSRALNHPHVVATLTWRIVRDEARLPRPSRALVGEPLQAPDVQLPGSCSKLQSLASPVSNSSGSGGGGSYGSSSFGSSSAGGGVSGGGGGASGDSSGGSSSDACIVTHSLARGRGPAAADAAAAAAGPRAPASLTLEPLSRSRSSGPPPAAASAAAAVAAAMRSASGGLAPLRRTRSSDSRDSRRTSTDVSRSHALASGCGGSGGGGRGSAYDEGGQAWLVLEYCDKGCLQDAIDKGWLRGSPACCDGDADLLAVLTTSREIAAAMSYLHDLDIVHGDLSSFNVLLTSASTEAARASRGFSAKVSDFGLSRCLDHKGRVERATCGTITHMAPEVLERGELSKAADVYSFGVVLWQMCAGRRAWAGLTHAAIVKAVCAEGRRLEFGPETHEGVALLAQACMARDPRERPSFREVLEVLEPLGAALVSSAAHLHLSVSSGRGRVTSGGGGGAGDAAAAGAGAVMGEELYHWGLAPLK